MKTARAFFIAVLVVAAAGGYVYAYGVPNLPFPLPWQQAAGRAGAPAATHAPRAFPVTAVQLVARPIPVTLGTIGTVQAKASVAIKSRVDGEVLKAYFTEGQTVHKGDPLFTIDPAPLQAALHQAEAYLARDQVQLRNAQIDLQRYQTLATKGIATQQQLDNTRATANTLAATIKADMAAIEAAKLQLSFTSINSPIDGKAGQILITPGNLVKANDTNPLVVINQIRPISVVFSLPERYLPEITRQMAARQLPVEARLPNLDLPPAKGTLTFINNAVNSATGTIELKATFANADERLVPGQFVDVVMTLSVLNDALELPPQALQNGQDGTYVYMVKPDQTVELRPTTVRTLDDGRMVVETGPKAGDTVVTEGQMRLSPGAKVVVKVASSQ